MMQKRILVIDDDRDILEILGIVLEDAGYEVFLSETGEETDHLQDIHPDLILMDVRLSGKSGASICSKLKSQPETSTLPVIMLSAEFDIREISNACGANAYISKPFDIDYLSDQVRLLLSA